MKDLKLNVKESRYKGFKVDKECSLLILLKMN